MDTLLKTIGRIVLSAIIIVIPLLCGLSFALSWGPIIQWVLTMGTLGVFGFVAVIIPDV